MDADGWTLTEWARGTVRYYSRMWTRGGAFRLAADVCASSTDGWRARAVGPRRGAVQDSTTHATLAAGQAWCDEYLAAVSGPPEPPP